MSDAAQPEITMYSTGWCPYCTRARHLLQSKGVDFEVIDIEEVEGARAEMQQRSDLVATEAVQHRRVVSLRRGRQSHARHRVPDVVIAVAISALGFVLLGAYVYAKSRSGKKLSRSNRL